MTGPPRSVPEIAAELAGWGVAETVIARRVASGERLLDARGEPMDTPELRSNETVQRRLDELVEELVTAEEERRSARAAMT